MGYFGYGDCSGGPLLDEHNGIGCAGFLGWMDLPAPPDWDTLTDMTVTVTLMNYVDTDVGQSAQDIVVDVYGDLIGSGESAFEDFPICSPGPEATWDFYDGTSISIPTVQPDVPLTENSAGISVPSGTPYLVTASFTISSELMGGGSHPWTDPRHIRVNFFTPEGPLFAGGGKGGGKGGGIDPCLFFASDLGLDPFHHELFVTMEYTAQ